MNKKFLILLLIFAFSCQKDIETNMGEAKIRENSYLLNGEKLYGNNNDSAFVSFNKSLQESMLLKDSIHATKALIYQSLIQIQEGDFFGSEESSVNALKFIKKGNSDLLSIYNAIAEAKRSQKDYIKSKIWYKRAINIAADSLDKINLENNLAVAYKNLGQYDSAIYYLNRIKNHKKLNNTFSKTKIQDNLAYIKFLQNKNYNAEAELYNALEIRKKDKDLWGQNASHSHLSDYFEEKNPQKALFHAHKMYEIAKSLKSPDDEIEALQKLINLENTENSKAYFNIYKNLNDSLQTARNKAKNQFALIRYDSEKNRADLLKSEAENALKQNHILKQNIALGLSFLAIIAGIFWYKKRRKRLEQEKEIEIKNTQLKYSKKVHDVVANGVYQVMTEVENTESIDKNYLLYQLENIYEKSRDISYEDAHKTPEENFAKKISLLINSYTSSKIQIFIVGNDEYFWRNVNPKIKSDLYMVIQELLINMKKHSFAKIASVKFEKTTNHISVSYFDNGIGLPKENFQKKHGLQNTENRIFSCGGVIIFDKNIEKGTKIKIEIPLEKK